MITEARFPFRANGTGRRKALRPIRRSSEALPSFRDDMKMRIIVRPCLVAMVLAFCACEPAQKNPIPAYDFTRYSLFTWNTDSGDFCFAIMIRAEADKFLHSGTAKRGAKCGASELKRTLIALPRDSQVFWEDWPPKHFDYPPENIVKEIIEFARTKGVRLEQSPALR
jgi:hypothetical protein